MKTILPILVLLATIRDGLGQTHNIAAAVSNNGQLAHVCDEFYFNLENIKAFSYPSRIFSQDRTQYKVSFEYSLALESGLEFGLNGGFGERKDNYVTNIGEMKASQQYMSFLPFIVKNWEVKNLQLSVGGGLPFHVASSLRAWSREYATSFPADVVANNTLAGGNAFGISAIGRVKWWFSPRFSLMATASFGVLHTQFGGDFSVITTPESFPINFPLQTRKQSGLTMPAPELSFGFGFRI